MRRIFLQSQTEIKPYYETENGRLYHGNCLDVMPRLPRVGAVFADPPYGVKLGSRKNNGRERTTYDETVDDDSIIERVVLPAISMARNLSDRVFVTPGNKHMFAYPKPTHVLCIYQPAGCGCNPWGFTTWQPLFAYGDDPYAGKGSRPDSFKNTEAAPKVNHPCPKPKGLIMDILLRCTFDDDMILDPFMGSGTTALVCERMGRRWIGIEISEQYCEVAAERIEAETKQRRLF